MEWKWCDFSGFNGPELYELLALRQEVFVVEQKCFYQDCDGHDQGAYHLIGRKGGRIVAYLRVIQPGIKFKEMSIGRVLTAPLARGTGLGKSLMREALRRIEQEFGPQPIRIAAQAHLDKFYRELGFEPEGQIFLEDGIPHLEMIRAKPVQ